MRRFCSRVANALIASLPLMVAVGTPANPRSHAAPAPVEQVGKVSFPTSCAPRVQGTIEKAIALLHSFQYEEAEQTFASASQLDSHCAIAEWGKAMSLDHQLWDFPSAATLAEGLKDVEEAQKRKPKTEREREYIAAAAAFFQGDSSLTHVARVQAYSAALDKLYHDNPKDVDAGAFYALSLVTLAQDGVDDLANRRKAIGILNPLFAKQPNNPGVAHYLIHASDEPELASQGLPAARAYARIAPDSSHATHMPSHIFRRLGLWQEMIDSNLAAIAAAAEATQAHRGDASYQFHPMDFLDYAYLQSGQEAKARHLVEEVKAVPGAKAEGIADHQALFAARNAIELHRWKEAASLAIPDERLMMQDPTYWARAIGAARTGDVRAAREDARKLAEVMKAQEDHEKMEGNKVTPGESVEEREVDGWLAFAEGKSEEAMEDLRGAAEREETDREEPIAMPAREMLADLLLELKRPAEALTEYHGVLKDYPNRFDALYGAARAAEAAANPQQAREFYAQLVKISAPGADRPELRAARDYVAANLNSKCEKCTLVREVQQ
jgi:tetratricopeptide (TPR) repeat protein